MSFVRQIIIRNQFDQAFTQTTEFVWNIRQSLAQVQILLLLLSDSRWIKYLTQQHWLFKQFEGLDGK
jgi:hypothetical protein